MRPPPHLDRCDARLGDAELGWDSVRAVTIHLGLTCEGLAARDPIAQNDWRRLRQRSRVHRSGENDRLQIVLGLGDGCPAGELQLLCGDDRDVVPAEEPDF